MPTVLITGSSKGIGFETALAFAGAGYKVLATMRNPSQSPTLAEVAARDSLPVAVTTMDVDSDVSVSEGIATLLRDHGPIDVLVNNAGIESIGSVEEQSLAAFRSIMETNYFGALRCVKALVPSMRQRGSGCIVNVSSIAGRMSCAPMTAYSASKWALEALSEGVAGEMKTFGVRVLLVEPGVIDTAMAQRIGSPETQSAYSHTARFAAMFSNALQHPVPPSIVAEKILEVVESGTWQLRHPVGPDALPLIGWRQSMTDEQWITINAADDETFFKSMSPQE